MPNFDAEKILQGYLPYYCHHWRQVGNPPNWFLNPFNGKEYPNVTTHWTRLSEFHPEVGDIKNIWNASRFNWVLIVSSAYTLTGEEKYLSKLNSWVNNWIEKNPGYFGPNWKCGQETSLRALNTFLAFEILDIIEPLPGFIDFIKVHIDRIVPTTYYAKAQDNNHGISEGAAMYILAYFLNNYSDDTKYSSIHRKGIKLLEDRVNKLIMNDGSFSQHSIVYHRMMLDLLSFVEILRQKWNLAPFSKLYYTKITAAIKWYLAFIDSVSGNAPNLGANDGTYLFNLNCWDYRDFRPTLALSATVFNTRIETDIKSTHPLLNIFNLSKVKLKPGKPGSNLFSAGGYAKLVRDNGFVLLRLPVYKYRPSHSDALHIDIWQDGSNWIRDAGSYSYALPLNELDNFSGTKGHSTIQFDDRNQMPRISRFLFGEWLKPSHLDFNQMENSIDSGYIDYKKAQHRRKVSSYKNGWEIIDTISGSFKKAVQRWILAPGSWHIQDYSVRNGNTSINVYSERISRFELIEGEESLFYMNKTPVPILEVEFWEKSTIQTQIIFEA